MVLRDDFDSEMSLEYRDVGMLLDGANQAGLYLGACIILVMKDAELRVPAFPVEVEFTVFFFVKLYAPSD